MLVLTRRSGETLYLGDAIKVTMVKVQGGQVRLVIDAPKDLNIWREEVAPHGRAGSLGRSHRS